MEKTRETIKRLLFAFALAASIAVLGWQAGLSSLWFALIASFSVLGLIDLVAPLIPLRLPPVLREIRSWESRGRAYRRTGVIAFGELLRRSPLRRLNRRVYLDALPRDFAATRSRVEDAEAAHFWGGVVTLPYLVLAGVQSWWSVVIGVVLFDLTANVYPILHLRSARSRLDRVLRSRRATGRSDQPELK
jgi:hypothetical protein